MILAFLTGRTPRNCEPTASVYSAPRISVKQISLPLGSTSFGGQCVISIRCRLVTQGQLVVVRHLAQGCRVANRQRRAFRLHNLMVLQITKHLGNRFSRGSDHIRNCLVSESKLQPSLRLASVAAARAVQLVSSASKELNVDQDGDEPHHQDNCDFLPHWHGTKLTPFFWEWFADKLACFTFQTRRAG